MFLSPGDPDGDRASSVKPYCAGITMGHGSEGGGVWRAQLILTKVQLVEYWEDFDLEVERF